jgi:SOS-response transcriptional repressor LexA
MDYVSILKDFYATNRRMPTYRELMPLFQYRTVSAVGYTLRKLARLGYITKDKKGYYVPTESWGGIRTLGVVEAGFPAPSEEDRGELSTLDEYLIPNKSSSFMLTVKGDSMQGAGILSGDRVIAERGQSAKVGDIVIAEVDGAWTMKYLRMKNGKHYLEAANPDYPDIYPEGSLSVAAIVRAVVRKY